jgi:hypothetical protein
LKASNIFTKLVDFPHSLLTENLPPSNSIQMKSFFCLPIFLAGFIVAAPLGAHAMVQPNQICNSFYGSQKNTESKMHLIICNELANHWKQPSAGDFVAQPASRFIAASDATLNEILITAQSKMIKSGLKNFRHLNEERIRQLVRKTLQESTVDNQPLHQSLSMLILKLSFPTNTPQ